MHKEEKNNSRNVIKWILNERNDSMREINVGKTIITKRKEKGITQDELAAYIGVSKASVSKWETAQSYPDITFLPQLATYFNISIDELIGYAPQMTKADISKLYHRLTIKFASKPFDEALKDCHEIIRKYYSCFPLLMQMVILLINHYMLAKEKAAQEAILQEAIELCRRIKAESDEVWMINEANSVEAVCCLMRQHPEKVLELLAGTMRPSPSDETVLASAYQMTGNAQKAKEVMQAGIYQNLIKMTGLMPGYLMLYLDDAERFEEILRRTLALAEIFKLDRLNAGVMPPVYLAAAQGYAMQNNPDRALDMIEKYVDLCMSFVFPFTLHGDGFFDNIGGWFDEFDLGVQAPRDEKVIRESMIQGIAANPAFAAFAEHPRYKSMMETMKTIIV